MTTISKPADSTSSTKENFLKMVSKNAVFEKVKKVATPILIVLGILLADIGAAFLSVSMPVLGAMIITSAISILAIAILKIKNQSESYK